PVAPVYLTADSSAIPVARVAVVDRAELDDERLAGPRRGHVERAPVPRDAVEVRETVLLPGRGHRHLRPRGLVAALGRGVGEAELRVELDDVLPVLLRVGAQALLLGLRVVRVVERLALERGAEFGEALEPFRAGPRLGRRAAPVRLEDADRNAELR